MSGLKWAEFSDDLQREMTAISWARKALLQGVEEAARRDVVGICRSHGTAEQLAECFSKYQAALLAVERQNDIAEEYAKQRHGAA